MSDAIDPADTSLREEDARKDGRRRFKKLAKGAPGDIRLVNKQGILSQGTRAVQFENYEWPVGLDEQEEADFEKEAVDAANEYVDEEEGDTRLDPDDGAEAARMFTAVEQLNLYFSHRANRTLAEIYPSADGTSILCFIDVFLDGEDLDDFQEHSEELTRLLADKKRIRAEEKAKRDEEKAAKEQQDKADMELGRKVREHNLIEKAREADEKLRAIRKAANRLAQKHGEKGWEDDEQ